MIKKSLDQNGVFEGDGIRKGVLSRWYCVFKGRGMTCFQGIPRYLQSNVCGRAGGEARAVSRVQSLENLVLPFEGSAFSENNEGFYVGKTISKFVFLDDQIW